MQIPTEITFRNMDASEAVEARVRGKVAKLERFFDGIIGCHVAIQAPHRRRHKGKQYHVRIELRVPGAELVGSRDPGDDSAHEDVYVAVRDAFDAIARQLEDYARKLRGDVKTHETPVQGRVVRLFPDEGYGFVATTDGREIYFHRNSVVNGSFDTLEAGTPVQIAVAEGESPQGPQASTVRSIGKGKLVG